MEEPVVALREEGGGQAVRVNVIMEEEMPLPTVMGECDPLRMKLLLVEEWWALEIKEAIEEDPELGNLSDFMYAQLALICENDVADAVRRAYGLQALRQEHDIQETAECGRRAVHRLFRLFPGAMLDFSFSEPDGHYFIAMDAAQFNTGDLTRKGEFSQLVAGLYFMMHTALPDLESVRKGGVGLVECQGLDFTRKRDLKADRSLYEQLWSVYPFTAAIWHYNTGVIFNVMFSLWKKLLPDNIRDRFKAGFVCEGGLNALFLTPNPEEATARTLRQMIATLQRRYDNQTTFALKKNG